MPRFVRVTDDSTPEDIATAALHLMRREAVVTDPATLAALDRDIAELRELYARVSA
jgi:hypothetical protein